MQVVETQGNSYESGKCEKLNIENSFSENAIIIKIMIKFDQMNNIKITKITDMMINKTEDSITKFEKQNDEWITMITSAMINKTEEIFSRFEEQNNKTENIFSSISNLTGS